MQLAALKVFCDLVETQSFSAAGACNGITQSAVTQRLQSLEKHVKVTLIERERPQLRLTPEGQIFLRTAREILRLHDETLTEIQALQNRVEGSLHVVTVLSVGTHELPVYAQRFRAEFPKVDLRISYKRSSQIYREISEGQADVGLVTYPETRKGLITYPFWKDRLVVICPPDHPLANRKMVNPKDLQGLDFVGFEPDLPTQKALNAMFTRCGVSVNQQLEFDNIETVKKIVALNQSVSIVPMRTVQDEVESGKLRALILNDPDCWRPLGIICKRTRAITPPMREFLRILKVQNEVIKPTGS